MKPSLKQLYFQALDRADDEFALAVKGYIELIMLNDVDDWVNEYECIELQRYFEEECDSTEVT